MTKAKKILLQVANFLLSVVIFMQIQQSHAKQLFSVSKDEAVLATISAKELSRLVFDSKITRVFGIRSEFHHEILDNSLYIKPHARKPINFFVLLDSGDTYKIIALLEDIPAAQITIKSDENDSSTLKSILHAPGILTGEAILQQDIKRIITSIMADEILDYKVKTLNKSYRKKRGIQKTLESVWSKPGIKARKYYLTNISSEVIDLNKRDYLDDSSAVYLNKNQIEPGQTAILITAEVLCNRIQVQS